MMIIEKANQNILARDSVVEDCRPDIGDELQF